MLLLQVRKGFNREVPKDAEKPSRAKQERLKDACKVAKEQLQQGMTTYTVQVEDYCKTKQGENLNLCVEVTGKEFDKAISTTLDKCLDVVQAAISAAAKTSGIAFTGADLQKVHIGFSCLTSPHPCFALTILSGLTSKLRTLLLTSVSHPASDFNA